MNRSRPTHHWQLQLEQQRKAALICVPVMLHQRLFASLYLFFCVCCKLLPNVFHTNDMFALSEKSAEKKTKTGRLPIAHYKQKPAGSDLWPVNRCIPTKHKIKTFSNFILWKKIHTLWFLKLVFGLKNVVAKKWLNWTTEAKLDYRGGSIKRNNLKQVNSSTHNLFIF